MSTGRGEARVAHSSLRKSLKLNSNPTDWWKVSLIMLLGDATDTLCSNYTETIQWRRAAATSCFLLRTGIHHIVATSFDTLRQPLATRPHKTVTFGLSGLSPNAQRAFLLHLSREMTAVFAPTLLWVTTARIQTVGARARCARHKHRMETKKASV